MALTVIAAYDVRDNDRRAHLAAILQAVGDRVQKSVFLLSVDADELDELAERCGQIIDVRQDSLWFTPCCASCWEGRVTVGQVAIPVDALFWVVV